MNRYAMVWILLFLFIPLASPIAGAEEPAKLETLRWMLGDWIHTTDSAQTSETWTATGNGLFKGIGKVTSQADGTLRSRESMLLAEMEGDVFYIAKVKENEFPIPFKLTESSANHAIFENRQHDFPKKLTYRIGDDQSLKVTVSDGAKRSFTIPFAKAVAK